MGLMRIFATAELAAFSHGRSHATAQGIRTISVFDDRLLCYNRHPAAMTIDAKHEERTLMSSRLELSQEMSGSATTLFEE